MVPRTEKPASSAARAKSVSCLPVVPRTLFGSPIPSSISVLSSLRVFPPIFAIGDRRQTWRAARMGGGVARVGSGGAVGAARRGWGAAGAAGDVRGGGGTDLE